MGIKLQYANEKFLVAAQILATSENSLRERVGSAWMSFHPLRESDFEGEMRAKYSELMKNLTKMGAVKNADDEVKVGSVDNTLSNISDDAVRTIAEQIFSMHVNIARDYYGALGPM